MEQFTVEQRKERGRILGSEQKVGKARVRGDRLLLRLRENAALLGGIHRRMSDEVTLRLPLTPVGEWLVDNYYVIEEQISLAERHLPPKYLKELPTLVNPGHIGIPRVYDLAEHIIAFGDGRVDIEDVSVIVAAYQEAATMTLGELWAIPIMLRLALIENIRRLAVLADDSRADRERARHWSDKMIRVDSDEPKNLILVVADMARETPSLTPSFVAELKRRLQGRSAGLKLPLQWIEQNLNERNATVEQAITEENQNQARMESSMRNCVTSLRHLNMTDWTEFVETMSLVEKALRQDPADVYARMDFGTRDSYRRSVENIARKGFRSELEVAERCLRLASEADPESADGPTNHVGYYLVGRGQKKLRAAVGFRGGFTDNLYIRSPRVLLVGYLGSIAVLTALFSVLTSSFAASHGATGPIWAVMTVLLVCASMHAAVGLVNIIASLLVKPRSLPRMDYQKGVPPELRTLVATPAILSGRKAATSLLKHLEEQYLNNRMPNVHFCLLTDFADAPGENMPGDAELLDVCRKGVEALNRKYAGGEGGGFFLFHRPRLWNEMERMWMGRERKRGKLEDLNRFLRGTQTGAFSLMVGDIGMLRNVKYVITLDADTVMARDSARQMIGAMAHPLVRAEYSEFGNRILRGHGILQPRVESNLIGANRSVYARMCATEMGIDPYTRASSDVYQDLFDEGSFIGKGIYDVEMFDSALGDCFPDNTILSHDLLEGCIVRSGLVNDIKVYEDPPSTYLADVARRHRWMRGDWQIASYMFAGAGRRKSSGCALSPLCRWKIFDNLRRSLTGPGLLFLLVLGLALLRNPGLYVALVLCVFIIPVVTGSLCQFVRKSPDKTLGQHFRNFVRIAFKQGWQAIFKFACLPFEACVCMDAIIRSLWRQFVSRRHLLQWKPFENSARKDLYHLEPVVNRMWICPVGAIAMALILLAVNPGLLPFTLPLLLLWFCAPLFVSLVSRPRTIRRDRLSAARVLFLRKSARRIWRFFEDFVNEGENWLPPDNYQEYPTPKIAHRTSPTNMGLNLLANLSAYDFGFSTAGQLLFRTGKTLDSMLELDRHRGHFYNWYDTVTREILRPAYISSVDSGNLAAHLRILASGLRALPGDTVVGRHFFLGVQDSLELALEDAEDRMDPVIERLLPIRDFAAAMGDAFPARLDDLYRAVRELNRMLDEAKGEFGDIRTGSREEAAREWLDAAQRQAALALEELDDLTPWAKELSSRPEWAECEELNRIPSLAELDGISRRLSGNLDVGREGGRPAMAREAYDAVRPYLERADGKAALRMENVRRLCRRCEELSDVEFDFLYDRSKRLLAIGYNVDERRLDGSYYDLLASEARLAAYLGVVRNQLPQAAWFALGRMLTFSGGYPLLVSWSGSMFEYLMPLLMMPTYENTLLDDTYKAMVEVQIEYGRQKGVPWGISESGFNVFDSEHNYQYRAFGVPDLGLKHGLSEDLVIAPYATALALMVAPRQACKNLERLDMEGFQGARGFYEAVDYTPSRLPLGNERVIVRSHMAHHQGMSLVAIGQALLNRPMHRRFEADPLLSSGNLLLQEMVPAERALYHHSTYSPEIRIAEQVGRPSARIVNDPGGPHPDVQLLSNGRYHVMISAAGGGYSRCNNLAVTRWREDGTLDNWGLFCYLRDRETGEVWSNTLQPTLVPAKSFSVVFAEGRAEFVRRDARFDTRTEIAVSPEDDVEVRRIRVHNHSSRKAIVDLTSFAEVALASPAADASHQAFSKLFVETSILRERRAIICSRRPSSPNDRPPLMFHMLVVHGREADGVGYETDRLAFMGRGRSAANPEAVFDGRTTLGGGEGAVIDPIVSIRAPLELEPGDVVLVDLITGVAADRERVHGLVDKYQDPRMSDKAFDLAWSHGQLVLRQLNATESDAQLFCRLAGSVVYPNSALRAEASIIARNQKGQSGLWGYAISGDLPIVLLKVGDVGRMELVKELLRAHSYWRQKGLAVDLVIWNDNQTGYRQNLHDQILGLAGASLDDSEMEKPGGIFIRSTDRVAEEDRILIQAVARVMLHDDGGTLEEQLRRIARVESSTTTTVHRRRSDSVAARRRPNAGGERSAAADSRIVRELVLFNEYGGFTTDGKEYVIHSGDGLTTPLTWVNVIANPIFGTVVSESGSSYTWRENSHEFRITPWTNDPVADSSGEALYIRDEQTGEFWSPTPLPCRGRGRFVTRHGFGYSVFEHKENDLRSELTVFVDAEEPIKYLVLKVRNRSRAPRSLSVFAYVEWVLGEIQSGTRMHVVTEIDDDTGALFARNSYNDEFRARIAFLDTDDPGRAVSGDRRGFLGRNGSLADPRALGRGQLSGKVGPALDPCGAMQVRFGLAPDQERKIIFRIGAGADVEDARRLIRLSRGPSAARRALEKVGAFWERTLGAVQVETPDVAFNFMVNGWLVYQVLSCRFWGRSATYQSGGAFGFRDQLQDSMALLYARPDLTRAHLVESAGRQFVEGDVLHWWHPPSGRGVRTKCSDDYLWLAYVAERYVRFTGDESVWEEEAGFLRGRELSDEEESYYDLFPPAEERANLYEHCRRAIVHGLRFGGRGLPLMGTGDWNDGMDRVGIRGKGESVWLGFFLHSVLIGFEEVARARKDDEFARLCRDEAERLAGNIETNAWDDDWYRRAYFDDGTPLGSAKNEECRIDSITQSWAVLSGVGSDERVAVGMRSLYNHLVDSEHGLVKLFAPPFDTSDMDPGYIKGYVPGVRENGGQYTHAAVWAGMAFARLRDRRRAWELLRMLNPVNHGLSKADAGVYKVEPYVVSADIYALADRVGRGGWSWYTGSAAWLYRFMIEELLGLDVSGWAFKLAPCVPIDWDGFRIRIRRGGALYAVEAVQGRGGARRGGVLLDNSPVAGERVDMMDDFREHAVRIEF